MQKFPHLPNASSAYGPGRELFEQISGEFDYGRWSEPMAHVRLMSVPWCEDYDNVVYFETESSRDSWLDEQPCIKAESAWRRAPSSSYPIEVPYTSALDYNYLVIDLPTETDETERLPNVSSHRVGRLCYFVSDMRPIAPSTTELEIKLDVWTTFVHRVSIPRVMLERGHAPMAETSVLEYLSNPMAKTRWLMAPDVDAGEAGTSRSAHGTVLDADVLAVIFTTSMLTGDWGAPYGETPARPLTENGSQTSINAWAIETRDLVAFLDTVSEKCPSFLQTVAAIACVPRNLVVTNESVVFLGHTVWTCAPARVEVPLVDLSYEDFGYPSAYKAIAKLYTAPYAHLELTDESGRVTAIRVEETAGKLALTCALSLSWPEVSVDTYVSGYGSGSRTVAWQLITGSEDAEFVGRWYDTLRTHDIALFSVREEAKTHYDWSNHHANEQRKRAAQNSRDGSNASSSAAYENATLASSTALTNASNSANNLISNNALNVALNNANTATKNAANTQGVGYSNEKLRTDVQYDIGNSNAAFDAQMAQLGVAATNNDARAITSGVTSVLGTIANVAGEAISGDIGGAVGAAVSGVTGAVTTAVDWQTSNASITVSQSNNVDVYNQSVTSAYGKQDASIEFNTSSTELANATATTITNQNNNTQTSVATNNANLVRANAENSRVTSNTIAEKTRNAQLQVADLAYETAISAIESDRAQAQLSAPLVHGTERPGTQGTRPMMVAINVVTESDGAIAYAGDAMLRYGYYLHGAWEIREWVPRGEFAYWKCDDVWISGARQTPERYQQELRRILIDGTTIWKDPEKIGVVSIYDNGY